QQRFPRPEFDSDYQLPETTAPLATSQIVEFTDIIVLATALAFATYFAIRKRSRRGLYWLSVFSVVYFGFIREGCVCPVGSLQNVAAVLTDPTRVMSISVVVIFLLPLAFALWVGRVFCSGVCPLGAIQELVLIKPIRLPPWVEHSLGLLRYVILGMAVLLAAAGSFFLICRYDPFVGLFRLNGSGGMMIFGLSLLLLSTVIARPYCRFLCPYGVLLGWMSQLASRRLVTCPDECIDCRLCEPTCPVGAIRLPIPASMPEKRRIAARRLVKTLLLTPVVIVISGWAIAQLDTVLAYTHPTVRLADRVAKEENGSVRGTTLESRTFRTAGRSIPELMESATRIREHFTVGGWGLGLFLGFVVMLKLIRLSVWRSRSKSEPDSAACLNCGRCFVACPQERVPNDLLQLEDAA
ncbi:MAG: 4Fe-4S binding protein, partial [bacterium]|nr:4Fe-4S binding protein [bacterium]